MKKVFLRLTPEQRERGVVFSSTLSKCKTEQPEDLTHEVFAGDKDKDRLINNYMEDSFFDDSPWKYNVIRR